MRLIPMGTKVSSPTKPSIELVEAHNSLKELLSRVANRKFMSGLEHIVCGTLGPSMHLKDLYLLPHKIQLSFFFPI